MGATIQVNLATEDVLSEQMLRVLLQQCGRKYDVGAVFRKNGSGYLKSKLSGFNNAAKGVPYVILTDLDHQNCVTQLISNWCGFTVKDYIKWRNPNLLFMIAVKEVEAWLLADRQSFAEFLGISITHVPLKSDEISDPKRELIRLARKTKFRRLREDLVPRDGSLVSIGPDYNGRLSEFLANKWQLKVAQTNSPSLRRANAVLHAFLPVFENPEQNAVAKRRRFRTDAR